MLRARAGMLILDMVLQRPRVLEPFLTVVTLQQRGFCMSRPHVTLQRILTNSCKTQVTFDDLDIMILRNVRPKRNFVSARLFTVRAFHILDYGVHAGNVLFESRLVRKRFPAELTR